MTEQVQTCRPIEPWFQSFEYSKQWWIPDQSHVVSKICGAAGRILKDLSKLIANAIICGLNAAHRRWHSKTNIVQDIKAAICEIISKIFNLTSIVQDEPRIDHIEQWRATPPPSTTDAYVGPVVELPAIDSPFLFGAFEKDEFEEVDFAPKILNLPAVIETVQWEEESVPKPEEDEFDLVVMDPKEISIIALNPCKRELDPFGFGAYGMYRTEVAAT